MSPASQFAINFLSLVFAFGFGVWHFRRLGSSLKILAMLIGVTLISETIAGLAGWYFRNNMVVYHIYTPVHLALTALYFNYYLDIFRKRHIGYWIAAVGVLVEILNTVFYQPFDSMNSNSIMFSAVCIIGMSLYAYSRFFYDEAVGNVFKNPHFWISFLFILFWSSTFLILAFSQYYPRLSMQLIALQFFGILVFVNAIYHLTLGFVLFFCQPQKQIS